MAACKKDNDAANKKYIATASKIVALAGMNWTIVEETQLKNKVDYKFEAAQPSASQHVKGEVDIPAIDDSSRFEDCQVYLHILPNNTIDQASYYTQPMSQFAAYAMMLNYVSQSLRLPTGVTPLQGQYNENGSGSIASVESILQKVRNNQTANYLLVTYGVNGRGIKITLNLTKRDNNLYEFYYGANP